ncbi:MAG: BspA family leucine-rich repeat surface protein [Prevotella sp.]|nr:BspA family leucine-rich repeat surface protein [Prevotella sp.]
MRRISILLSILLLLMGQEAEAEKTAQAIVTNDKTMHFVYDEPVTENGTYKSQTVLRVWSGDAVINDEDGADWNSADAATKCTKVIFDASFASVRPKVCKYWFMNFYYLTAIEGLQYLNTSEVTSMQSMFANCALLTTLDVTSFDTQNVTDMSAMFQNCSKLTELNLANFRTDKVTKMSSMFQDCTKLTTIYVSKLWSAAEVGTSSNMFDNCQNLKGGNGTTFTAGSTNKDYARIDAAGTPGYLTESGTVFLHDNADNTPALTAYNGQTKTVTIVGRTLYKDNSWNTLCLPFSMTAEQVTSQLAPAKLKTLSSATFADGTLTLNFSEATTIEAGKPYIIKWASGDNITSPEFTNVTISSAGPTDVTGTAANFHGIYAPYSTDGENKKMLYLGADNKVYYPSKSRTINAFRAYFTLNNGIEAGDPTSTSALAARAFVLNFDDGETTGITDVNTDSSLFTLRLVHRQRQPSQWQAHDEGAIYI